MRFMNALEIAFVTSLLEKSSLKLLGHEALSHIYVEDADDGGMGGLIFISGKQGRKLGRDIASREFTDQDGTKVIATLSLDNFGDLYELDVWKTDFSRLLSSPQNNI